MTIVHTWIGVLVASSRVAGERRWSEPVHPLRPGPQVRRHRLDAATAGSRAASVLPRHPAVRQRGWWSTEAQRPDQPRSLPHAQARSNLCSAGSATGPGQPAPRVTDLRRPRVPLTPQPALNCRTGLRLDPRPSGPPGEAGVQEHGTGTARDDVPRRLMTGTRPQSRRGTVRS